MKRQQMTLAILVKMGASSAPRSLGHHRSALYVAEWAFQNEVNVVYLDPDALFFEEGELKGKGWCPQWLQKEWFFCEGLSIDLIYNRFPRLQSPESFAQVVEWAERAQVPLANHPSLQDIVQDKWRTHRLFESSSLRLPQTVLGASSWREWLEMFGKIYIKPLRGAFGEGIFFLRKEGANQIRVEGFSLEEPRFLAFDECERWLRELEHRDAFIVQQAIEPILPEYRGLGIRSLVQRIDGEHWVHAPQIARMSRQDPVANVAQGAHAEPLADLLQRYFPDKRQMILEDIERQNRLAIEILLEDIPFSYRSHILEMGFDYIIDPDGKAWLIEVNGFPQGKLLHLAQENPQRFDEISKVIHRRPLDYLLSLSMKSPVST